MSCIKKFYVNRGGGGGHEYFWPFSRGLLKNTHKLLVKISMDLLIITQK